MQIYLKNASEIAKQRACGRIVHDVLDAVEEACRPGTSTWQLNEIAQRVMSKGGASSAFLGYRVGNAPPYPAVICASINEVVVHGIPKKNTVLEEGDIIGIDFACFKEQYCADAARTIAVGKVAPEARRLIDATRDSLMRGIEQCLVGNRLQDIGHAVQSHVEPMGYSVVKSFVGHGIGRAMHEDPPVPNYGKPGKGYRLKPGMVLAIEPMVNVGTDEVLVADDGWTALTRDHKLSAHFEHSVAITDDGPVILTVA
jgi:methionyl aminopeptidase